MTDWFDAAVCRGMDQAIFFPPRAGGDRNLQRAEAQAVCRRCPVTTKCLDFAIDTNEEFGIWGGLTLTGRNAIRRQRRRDAA